MFVVLVTADPVVWFWLPVVPVVVPAVAVAVAFATVGVLSMAIVIASAGTGTGSVVVSALIADVGCGRAASAMIGTTGNKRISHGYTVQVRCVVRPIGVCFNIWRRMSVCVSGKVVVVIVGQ
mgnify:CR=1 FL=1